MSGVELGGEGADTLFLQVCGCVHLPPCPASPSPTPAEVPLRAAAAAVAGESV